MVSLKKLVRRYMFFLLLLLISIVLLIGSPELGRKAVSLSLDNLKEMLSIIPPIFILLGLMDVWVPKETMMRYMGREAGIRGSLFAFILGAFSAGPLYAAFPVAAVFLRKGVSLFNVFIFLGSWSTAKIPMMLFEVTQLGGRFAAARFAFNLIGIVIISLIMERTTSEEESRIISETASSQIEGQS